MKQLVRLWERPSHDRKKFRYYLLYTDEQGKRRQKSLGHSDRRRVERQRAKLERYLRMGEPTYMTLKEFTKDSLTRTGDQIRESTCREYRAAMEDFVKVVRNGDYQRITLKDAEFYRQSCLDRGNSPATVAKKLRHVKCVFEAAVKRRLLDENPLEHIKMPRYAGNEIRRYSDHECERTVKAAHDLTLQCDEQTCLKWDLLIVVALSTALRRGELLNCTWGDVDFEEQTIKVSPKEDTAETWKWLIKDTDRRTLPLTDELTQLLIDHHSRQSEGYPYVFVPPARYDHIQRKLRAKGK